MKQNKTTLSYTQIHVLRTCSSANPDGTAPGATCPLFGREVGITDSLLPNEYQVYNSFELTTPVLTLQAPEGSTWSSSTSSTVTCNPFQDLFGPQKYPESTAPQCVQPTTTDTMVCAFKFENNLATVSSNNNNNNSTTPQDDDTAACLGRKYALVEYPSADAAKADGAVVTHTGNCGVCSSAADFAAYVESLKRQQSSLLLCGVSFNLSREPNRFDILIDCLSSSDRLGYSRPCSTQWAFATAAFVDECSSKCEFQADGLVLLNNKTLPGCPFTECWACAENVFQTVSVRYSGRSLQNSGIIEDIVRPCADFSNIVHDACPGTNLTDIPTPAPTTSSTATGSVLMRDGGWRVLWAVTSALLGWLVLV